MHTPTLGYADTNLTRALCPITQSGLLATVAAQLLTFFKVDSNFKHPESAARVAILVLTYISLISGILATAASVLQTRETTDSLDRELAGMINIDTQLGAYDRFVLSCGCGNANAISDAVMLLFIVSSCTVISIVVYLILEEGRKIVISVLVISVLFGYSMVLYIALIVSTAMDKRRFSTRKANNDARLEAKEDA